MCNTVLRAWSMHAHCPIRMLWRGCMRVLFFVSRAVVVVLVVVVVVFVFGPLPFTAVPPARGWKKLAYHWHRPPPLSFFTAVACSFWLVAKARASSCQCSFIQWAVRRRRTRKAGRDSISMGAVASSR